MLRSLGLSLSVAAGIVAVTAVVAFYHHNSKRRTPNRILKMNQMEDFKRANVHMKDPARVEELLSELIKGGKEKLQVVSDFDKTITRHTYNGQRVPSCHGVLDTSKVLPEKYRVEALKLRDYYLPIEFSHDVEPEEKYKAMITWWTTAHNLLVKCDVSQEQIAEIVRNSQLRLRDGVPETLEVLHAHNVPLLIFSAGVGDILKEAIKQKAQMHSNIHVISNFMDFNSEGKLVGFKGDLIHTFNKHEVAVHHPEIFESRKNRPNIILLGDTLGDLTMVDGMPYRENVLTIGFLNGNVQESLDIYKDKYDIVLEDEGSFDLMNTILRKIL